MKQNCERLSMGLFDKVPRRLGGAQSATLSPPAYQGSQMSLLLTSTQS